MHAPPLLLPDGRSITRRTLARELGLSDRTVRHWLTVMPLAEVLTRQKGRQGPRKPDHIPGLCSNPWCRRPGPFYARTPQNLQCITCRRHACRQRNQATTEARNAQHRATRLRKLLRQDPAHLSRRQRHWLARQQTPPGLRYCPWDEHYAAPGRFRHNTSFPDGIDVYCRACRQSIEAEYRHTHRRRAS